jgi:hypothetical protein
MGYQPKGKPVTAEMVYLGPLHCWEKQCLLGQHPGDHWGVDEFGRGMEWSSEIPKDFRYPFTPTMDIVER